MATEQELASIGFIFDTKTQEYILDNYSYILKKHDADTNSLVEIILSLLDAAFFDGVTYSLTDKDISSTYLEF